KQLAADFPAVTEYRQELALSHHNLAVLLKDLGRAQEAEDAYREAIALQKQLTTEFPAKPGYRQDLARSRNNLGMLLKDKGRLKEAEEAYREAIALYKPLAEPSPHPDYRVGLAR